MPDPGMPPSHSPPDRKEDHEPAASSRPSANRNGPRSRAGCWTCREKKVKCDEQRPECQRCIRLRRHCDYRPRPRKPYTRRGERQQSCTGSADATNSSPSASSDDPSSPPDADGLPIRPGESGRQDGVTIMAPLAPPEQRAACSVMLSPGDHEAIYYYRTRFATTHHTKNPQYSFFSVLFLFAENHPMPMHMVLALSDQDMNYWKRGDFGNSRRSVAHYTSALHLMSKAMSVDGSSPDLDTILATLWLMIVYEQKYGDGQGIGLSKHLQGAASILRTRFKPLLDAFAPLGSASQGRPGIGPAPNVPPGGLISLFAARMVVWMSVLDAGASYGIGGQIGGSINKLVRQIAGDDKVSILRGFAAIHGYSQPLFHATWGNSYPQAELLDDAENRKVYLLYVKTAQLRYETAELMALHKCDPAVAALRLPAVERAFFLVREEFSDLLNIASRLSLELDHSRRLVQNMRFVVPHYYTVVLEFLRFTRFSEPLNDEQRHALHEIMQLAFQGYRYDGEKAIVRIPLPLLFAGMETDDLVHREWILTRYEALCRYGKNYTRAFRFLKAIVEEQARLGERVDTMYLMSSGGFEQFVI